MDNRNVNIVVGWHKGRLSRNLRYELQLVPLIRTVLLISQNDAKYKPVTFREKHGLVIPARVMGMGKSLKNCVRIRETKKESLSHRFGV